MSESGRAENVQRRLFWVEGLFAILMIVLWGGLITRQIIQHKEYKSLEQRQSVRRVLVPAPRGVIYDRNGKTLVSNQPRFSLIVYLGELRDQLRREQIRQVRLARKEGAKLKREEVQARAIESVMNAHLAMIQKVLGREIPIEPDAIQQHLYRSPLLPYTVLGDLTLDEFARLTELLRVEAPFQLKVDSVREYPYGDLASHVLGFVSMRNPESDDAYRTFSLKEQQGVAGIEKTFDEKLSGKTGHELWVVDPSGFRYEPKEIEHATPGESINLTIDVNLQQAIERAFREKIGAAAAIDINSGEVLALVSKPSYDPNELVPFFTYETDQKIRKNNGWLNRAIQGLYPPGSTFKIVTALAAFRTGHLDLTEKINCPGYLQVGRRRFPCNNHHGHGEIDVVTALEKSCNVFFYELGLRTGPQSIVQAAKQFGLDKPTGIELPGETHRMLLPTAEWKKKTIGENWYDGDTANMSIGQGYLLVTPLQMACMTASVARSDTLTTPTIIKEEIPVLLPRQDYDAAHQKILEGMRAATKTGTARLVQVADLEIAAKTGTAQVTSNGKRLTLAWFVGFAPADNPQTAIAVVVEEQNRGDGYAGGTTAAPIARHYFEAWKSATNPLAPSN